MRHVDKKWRRFFQSPLIYFIFTSSLLAGLLFWSAAAKFPGKAQASQRLFPAAIRGVEVLFGGRTYALNFKQQNLVVSFLNKAKPASNVHVGEELWQQSLGILVLHYFEKELEEIPLALLEDEALVFRFPPGSEGEILIDQSQGAFRTTIKEACK